MDTRDVLVSGREEELDSFSRDDEEHQNDRDNQNRDLMKLLDLPRYRPQMQTILRTYYAVGHDPALSSLSGISSAKSEQGEKPKAPNGSVGTRDGQEDLRLTLENMSDEERKNLNFFYGGCGDCRHVLMTLFDLGKQFENGAGDVLVGNCVHFLLNDINPAILARWVVILVALQDLSKFSMEDIRKRDNEDVIDTLAILHFTYLSPVVPRYVDEKLRTIAQRIIEDAGQFPFMLFADETLEKIHEVLRKWLGVRREDQAATSAEVCVKHFWENERSAVLAQHADQVRLNEDKLLSHIEDCGLVDLDQLGADQEKVLDELISINSAILIDESMAELRHHDVSSDLLFWSLHQVLPPPTALLSRHSPQTGQCSALASNEEEVHHARTDFTVAVARQIGTLLKREYNKEDVLQDYVTNLTGLDPLLQWEMSASQSAFPFLRPPRWNPVKFLAMLYRSAIIEAPSKQGLTMFDLSCSIWERAAFAMKHLLSESKSSLSFELTCGDMNAIAKSIALGEAERTRRGIPTQFLRAFTSNVPDYTGMLYPLNDIVPLLAPSTKAFLRCNVLYNMIRWSNYEEYATAMTLVESIDDTAGILGAHVLPGAELGIDGFAWWGVSKQKLPKPQELYKNQIVDYLCRVFLGVVFPPSQPGTKPILYPESLVVFMDLLFKFIDRGLPKTWISDLVNKIIFSNFKIENPRPPQRQIDCDIEEKMVPIAMFALEFKSLLALYQSVLKLDICDLPPVASVALRSVAWREDQILTMNTDEIGVVVFPNKYRYCRPRELVSYCVGKSSPAHFFSVLHWSLAERTVKFFLPDKEYEEMRESAFSVILISTCTYEACTKPAKLV